MDRSRLASSTTSNLDPEERQNSRKWRQLPLAISIGSMLVGGIWFFQQTNLRHLNGRIEQLQRDTARLPKNLAPLDLINLEKEQIALERDRIIAQNGVYTLLFRGIGAVILGGLTYAIWQHLRRTEERFQSLDRQQITDRLGRAISHLASDKMEIRLGGIYTLERLAQESPTEYWLTIEILTAFVRERSSARREQLLPLDGNAPPSPHKQVATKIPTDIQAVMTVLIRRDVSQDPDDRIVELRESNLRAADLNGVELWGADLWKVNLREAQLWQAKLAGAFLGRANLSDASLWQADLEGAYLWKANLEGANLSEANLARADLEGSNFKGANLNLANLIEADLRKVIGLTSQQLGKAICDETTQLPDYIEPARG